MELNMLYVVEIRGEKHFFGKDTDRSYWLNRCSMDGFTDRDVVLAKKHEISLAEM